MDIDDERPAAAAARVFAIFELAESIFLGVPARDLLINVQRTNRTFYAIIGRSKPIQQALFFEPFTSDKLKSARPLKADEKRPWTRPLIGIAHPLVSQDSFRVLKRRETFDYPGASWQRQHITQPPIDLVSLVSLGWIYKATVPLEASKKTWKLSDLANAGDGAWSTMMKLVYTLTGFNCFSDNAILWKEKSAREFLQQIEEVSED